QPIGSDQAKDAVREKAGRDVDERKRYDEADQGETQRLRQDRRHQPSGRGAQREADAELPPLAGDALRGDAINADHRESERRRSENSQQQADDPHRRQGLDDPVAKPAKSTERQVRVESRDGGANRWREAERVSPGPEREREALPRRLLDGE